MSTSVTRLRQGSLRIGSGGGGPPQNKDNWKKYVGQKRVGARFTLLQDPEPRWGSFGGSVLLQMIGLTLLITVPMLFPQKLIPIMRYEIIPLAAPPTEVPLPPEPPKVVKLKPRPQPPPEKPVEPPKVAKILPPPKPIVPKVKPKPLPVEAAPKIEPVFTAAKIDAPKAEPKRPRPPVETGVMSTGSAAPATLTNKRPDQVQTGGFGDPNGIPGKGDPNKRANAAQRGSMDLPPGPGYGNGTGGANGARGTIASAGFGNGVAIPPTTSSSGRRGTVQQSGFSDASKITEAPKKAAAQSTAAVQPVEILSKPRPAYSEEARHLKIEGEVLLDVVFGANGQIRVNHVTRGLGHGLDESATRAAQQIRYKPALRDGQAVDFPATVHIVFQLAY